MGLGTAVGGPEARYRGGAAVDALLGVRVSTLPHGALIVGLAAGGQGAPLRDDVCLLTPSGQCLPDFPLFGSVGPFAGWESPGGTLRLLAGAALFRSDEERSTGGLTGRIDLALPARVRITPILSLRTSVLPSYRGDPMGLVGIGVGLRIR